MIFVRWYYLSMKMIMEMLFPSDFLMMKVWEEIMKKSERNLVPSHFEINWNALERLSMPNTMILIWENISRFLTEEISKEDLTLEEAHRQLEDRVEQLISKGKVPFVVGGGNDQTYSNASALLKYSNVINVDPHLHVRPLVPNYCLTSLL